MSNSGNVKAQMLLDTGNIFNDVTSIINAMPGIGGDDFHMPTERQQEIWENTLETFFDGNFNDAADSADLIDYTLTQYYDNSVSPNATYYLFQNTGTNYWGTYICNFDYCRPLVVQAPHPKFDFNTGKQALHVFREVEAFFYCMAGTHRCNQSIYSTCDGTTDVCGADEDFRISDMAHKDSTLFHLATRSIYNRYSGSYFLQLHGFTKGASDPYVILSNGTRDTPTLDYIETLVDELYIEDTVLTFKVVHWDQNWDKQAGLVNTQGRMINGSSDPCDQNPSSASGRFIHMEQEKTRLRADISGWTIVANAVASTFPCDALPVQWLGVDIKGDEHQRELIWQTASEHNSDYFEIQYSNDGKNWIKSDRIMAAGNSESVREYVFTDLRFANSVVYYRIKQVDFNGEFIWSGYVMFNPGNKIISIYPNPAKNEIQVSGKISGNEKWVIRNISGQEEMSGELNSGSVINISQIKPGFYWLEVVDGYRSTVQKIVIN